MGGNLEIKTKNRVEDGNDHVVCWERGTEQGQSELPSALIEREYGQSRKEV